MPTPAITTVLRVLFALVGLPVMYTAQDPVRPDAGAKPPPAGTAGATTTAAAQAGYLPVAEGQLYYECAGDGPVLVLLHDGILHSAVWDAQWREFAGAYRVVRYDRRGYGRSTRATAPYTDLADLEAVLAGLHIERATLIGSSSGGELALLFTAAHPEQVDALVLVGAVLDPLGYSAHFMDRAFANEAPELDEKVARWTADPYLVTPGNDAARSRVAELLADCPHNLGDPGREYQRPIAAEIVARWTQIALPTLIVVGAADIPDVHAHAGALEAGLIGAQRVVLSGAGHLPYLEQPQAFNRTVGEFLDLAARRVAPGGPRGARGFARVDGTALYYESRGAGEPVVLLHGGCLDHRMWDDQVDAFAQRWRVVRYDIRGHGLSKGPPGSYRDEDDLRRLLDHLGLPRAHLVGLSLGGRIAIDFALAYPDRVASLVAVSPGLSGYALEGADLKAQEGPLLAALRAGDCARARECMQRAWTDGPRRTPEQVAPRVRSAVRRMLDWSVVPARDLAAAQPLQPPASGRLGALRAPTLAVVGALDMSDILSIAERIAAEVPGARQTVIADAAHMVNMERPDEFNRIVLEFLDQQCRPAPSATSQDTAAADGPQASAEAVVAALYRRVSFTPESPPDWQAVRALFRPEAVIVLRTARERTQIFSVEGFIRDFTAFAARPEVQARGFTESIVRAQPLEFGDLAHYLVVYEACLGGSEQPPQRGIDSIELIRTHGRWEIVAITNEICTPERPPPAF